MDTLSKVEKLLAQQKEQWPQAGANYAALADVEVKDIALPGMNFKVQFNPARIASTGAKVDAAAIKARKCFLCASNRPEQQEGIDWNDRYTILVNPFPIFPKHLTIPDKSHTMQLISGRMADMMRLAGELDGYTVFYNGPRCGASAPDHMHFQAGNSDFLTIWEAVEGADLTPVFEDGATRVSVSLATPLRFFVIDTDSPEAGAGAFERLYAAMPVPEGESEPMMNVLCRADEGRIRAIVIPRKRHRPSFYGDGEGCMLLSPASVDLGGVLITPRKTDFDRIDRAVIEKTLAELCLDGNEMRAIAADVMADKKAGEPTVSVGIMSAGELSLNLLAPYTEKQTGAEVTGPQTFAVTPDGRIEWQGKEYDSLLFTSAADKASFEADNVTIGVNFHWERKEVQRFLGDISIIVEGRRLTLINILPVESYLESVISSEMSASAWPEFLKAHAVISRSWLLAQIDKTRRIAEKGSEFCSFTVSDKEIIRWYDREDHAHFDVCADDHCQRYQGITRQTSHNVHLAVEATRGQVLLDNDGHLCDTRFSKSCGGVFEQFETCWEPRHHHYLEAARDGADRTDFPDLTVEENAREWILSSPEAFCNTDDKEILGQVLNNYDLETTDFYRWKVEYTQDELAEIIKERSGIDFGLIVSLEPVERGTSGRLSRLRITGTRCTVVIGKELEIRRTLSTSHLYSSAFVVEAGPADERGVPARFTLHGAGWGHGVGLCQIGAAVMGAKGYTYDHILQHYFNTAKLTTLY